ncbi:hypothetical protein Golob_026516 [Gossypium lobatum]|uniref:RNase H type-1 domain-containing protein n=1 Tax=Gossypium lobatum TaxID=34289 RepID=A0A7J8LVD2_9ROSI|nr:hypothetical protein [Gossypium lobatum]
MNKSTLGLVVRDSQWVVLVTKQKLHDRVDFPFAVEDLAYLLAVRLSIQWSLQHVTSFQQLKFAYVPRSTNIFAHNLATECLRTGKESYLDLGTVKDTRMDLCPSDQENQIDSRKGNIWVEGKAKKCKRSVFWEHFTFRNLAPTQASRIYFWRMGAS